MDLGVAEPLEMEGIYVIYMNSITEYTRSVRNCSSGSNKSPLLNDRPITWKSVISECNMTLYTVASVVLLQWYLFFT